MVGRARPWTKRLALFAFLWLALAGPELKSPALAGLSVLAAAAVSLKLWPGGDRAVRWPCLPSLIAYFLWKSLVGGADVAWRAVSPRLPVKPDVIEYQCRLEGKPALVLFIWMIGLMPGTASVGFAEGTVTVHVIDRRSYAEPALRRLEAKIGNVFRA